MLDTRGAKVGSELDHADQYRMLREEILEQVRDTRRLETLTLGALAIFYTWVLTHGVAAGGRGIYWLAPLMVLLAGVRAWVALSRIAEIAAYLREIELVEILDAIFRSARTIAEAVLRDDSEDGEDQAA